MSQVISELLTQVQSESEIGAGDISNIIDVLALAIDVQNERISGAGDRKFEYASNYTHYSSSLVNDVLSRAKTWMGIPKNKKHMVLSNVQVCNVTKFSMWFSSS